MPRNITIFALEFCRAYLQVKNIEVQSHQILLLAFSKLRNRPETFEIEGQEKLRWIARNSKTKY